MSTGTFQTSEVEGFDRRRHLPIFAQDAFKETRKERAAFEQVRRAERQFAVKLRKIAAHIQTIVEMFHANDPGHLDELVSMLNNYAYILRPWARAVSRRLLAEVRRRDEKAWFRYSRMMGVAIRQELMEAPVGHVQQQLMEQQVELITSLPLDAARRVHELATGSIYEGARAAELSEQILATGHVTKARANLIARTETSRAAATFAQARAQAIGSPGYIWRTSKDRRVRPIHRHLEGTFHAWDDPPVSGQRGERSHPGCIYNCFPDTQTVGLEQGLLRLYRAAYDGPLVRLAFESEIIEATPGHPVLTERGFVAAGLLEESDKIICLSDECGSNQEELISFGDLFVGSLSFGAFNVPASDCDFYGDVFSGNIDVIRLLCDRGINERPPVGFQSRRLVDKSVRNFSGHVFTLESATGLYSVGAIGMQVKNCRCYPEPVLPE